MEFIISALIAYLLGSVSFGLIIPKLLKLPDPRTQGSGNAGASNVWRLAGKQAGIYVFIGDALKGLIAVLIARLFHVSGIGLGFVALAVVLGHVFPLYFKFKGGKGVATAIGALLGLSLAVTVFVAATWAIIALIFRYVSVASMVAVITIPIYLFIGGHPNYGFPAILAAVLIVWKHWSNIERLRAGTENKLQF